MKLYHLTKDGGNREMIFLTDTKSALNEHVADGWEIWSETSLLDAPKDLPTDRLLTADFYD